MHTGQLRVLHRLRAAHRSALRGTSIARHGTPRASALKATLRTCHDRRAISLFSAIDAVCSIIRERGGIDGFNFGVNVGAAAGQTVPHLHQHVNPRRTGDMPDPRGGVRHVIPGKGNYLIARDAPRVPSIADVGSGQPWRTTPSHCAD
ncbi:MAG: HIT domain-containing protein [Xanthomonadales bacterium]|nr:HIT domain-containing protein [Xanthomonadales bacterium]